jgi:hypothetical protein
LRQVVGEREARALLYALGALVLALTVLQVRRLASLRQAAP